MGSSGGPRCYPPLYLQTVAWQQDSLSLASRLQCAASGLIQGYGSCLLLESTNSGNGCRDCHSVINSAEAANESFNFTRIWPILSQNVTQSHEAGLDMYREFLAACVIRIYHSPRSANNAMNIRPQPHRAGNNHLKKEKAQSLEFLFFPPVLAMPSVSDALSDDVA